MEDGATLADDEADKPANALLKSNVIGRCIVGVRGVVPLVVVVVVVVVTLGVSVT